MNKNDLKDAVRFALNGWVKPVKIYNIKYLSSTDEYKVRCSEMDEDLFTYRCTLCFKKDFIKRCYEWRQRGVRRWANAI